MTPARLKELASRFPSARILVVGDLMLDEFIWGKVARISPEAPVPVVEVAREECFPGGAANVARNLAEFTKGASVLGAVGDDAHGERLRALLRSEGVRLDGLVQDAAYRTIVKTRVIARQQHVVRIDRERRVTLTPGHAALALAQVEAALPRLDAIIIEDYGKGLLDQDFAARLCALANRAGKILAVDPNPHNPLRWEHVTVIKPNRAEAFASAGRMPTEPGDSPTDDAALLEVGATLGERWHFDQLLVTLGEQGMILFQKNAAPYHAPTRALKVFDVSGAGDTVIALYTLALCAGATPPEAAEIANHASGVVVGKLGTATCTPAELLASFES
jgi:D-beta-D-heptose 7-phosphate kinase/D-beta-D-heptose 1-phosphate adenosyltransferase